MTSNIDVLATIIGTGGALTTVGTGIAFVWNKVEKRFTSIEASLAECQSRERASENRRSVQLTVIELLWLKVQEMDPASVTLSRAKMLLDGLKMQLPPENADLSTIARRLDN